MVRIHATILMLLAVGPAFGQDRNKLELLILANGHDDKHAIEDASRLINGAAGDSETMFDLAKCQKDGLPPPVPRAGTGLKKYELTLFGNAKSVVRYRWVELSSHEVRALNLDNEAKNDKERNGAWKYAMVNRDKAVTLPWLPFRDDPDKRLFEGALFYSRDCHNRNLSEAERDKKKVDYFVLARRAEIDPKDAKQEMETSGVTSNQIVKVTRGNNKDSGPHLLVKLNAEGTKALAALTTKNNRLRMAPSLPDGIRRHLAIVFEGQVLSAPTLNSSITGGQFMISGVSEKALDMLAEKLQPKKE